jgi:hypothetical protein
MRSRTRGRLIFRISAGVRYSIPVQQLGGIAVKQNIQRVRLFCKLVRTASPQNQRLGFRQAWRVAGISTGKVVAMPDDMIEWWWKIQDVVAYDVAQKKVASAAAGEGGDHRSAG